MLDFRDKKKEEGSNVISGLYIYKPEKSIYLIDRGAGDTATACHSRLNRSQFHRSLSHLSHQGSGEGTEKLTWNRILQSSFCFL